MSKNSVASAKKNSAPSQIEVTPAAVAAVLEALKYDIDADTLFSMELDGNGLNCMLSAGGTAVYAGLMAARCVRETEDPWPFVNLIRQHADSRFAKLVGICAHDARNLVAAIVELGDGINADEIKASSVSAAVRFLVDEEMDNPARSPHHVFWLMAVHALHQSVDDYKTHDIGDEHRSHTWIERASAIVQQVVRLSVEREYEQGRTAGEPSLAEKVCALAGLGRASAAPSLPPRDKVSKRKAARRAA